MNIENFLLQVRLKAARKKKRQEAIEHLLINSKSPEKVVDCLSNYEINDLSNDVLKLKVKGYRNLYDYILKGPCRFLNYDRSNNIDIELSQTALENGTKFAYYTEEELMSIMPNGQLTLDFALKDPYFFSSTPIKEIKTIKFAKELIKRIESNKFEMLQKTSPYELLDNISFEALKIEISPNKILLEALLEHNVLPKIKNVKEKQIRGFAHTEHDFLFKSIKDGKRVIDYLLESNIDIDFEINAIKRENWPYLMESCLKHRKYHAISEGPEDFFAQKFKVNGYEDNLFLYLNRVNAEPTITSEIKDEEIINGYIFHSQNILNLIENCSVETLTNTITGLKGKPVLEFIIVACQTRKNLPSISDIAHALYKKGKMNEKISLILADYKCFCPPDTETKELGIDKDQRIQEHIYNYNQIDISLSNKQKKLFENFKATFTDNVSNKDIIEDVIYSFKKSALINPTEAIRDLEALILYKNSHPTFKLTNNSDDDSHFLKSDYSKNGEINIKFKNEIAVLNHELGNLIHEAYDDSNTPQQIENLIPYDYDYFKTHSKESNELFKQINEEAESLLNDEKAYQDFLNLINQEVGNLELYKNQIKNEYITLIGTGKILIEALKDEPYGMSGDTLSALANALHPDNKKKFLSEEYINQYIDQRLKAEFEKFRRTKYTKDNELFLCYENFVDAYYGGALGKASEEVSNKKAPTCTHTTEYFIARKRQFQEMFANYVALKKEQKGQEYIEKLKEKTSPELISAIEDYYKNIGLKTEKKLR